MRPPFVIVLLLVASGCAANGAGGADGSAAGSDGPATGPADRVIDLPPLPLAAGQELQVCDFVPPDGIERQVHAFAVHMTPGSHHLSVMRARSGIGAPATGPEPCAVGLFEALLPGSQQPDDLIELPPGTAITVRATDALIFQSHYINASTSPIVAHVRYELHTMEPSAVQVPAGELFFNTSSLVVPAGVSTIESRCTALRPATLLELSGHMHERGRLVELLLGGTLLYSSNQWDNSPSLWPAPAVAVATGDTLRWRCTFDNETGAAIPYGNSALTDEMCLIDGIYVPAPDSASWYCDE